ncbi:MAG: Fe-S cluster assembly protein SufD [Chloroflexi bacterium]|nr:Fe-S cluster assembly protein SufD [Chloroflexota bacterium]
MPLMTVNTPTVPAEATRGISEAAYQALSRQLDEPEWLRRRRQEAWERLQASGPLTLPTDKGQKTLPALPVAGLSPLPAAGAAQSAGVASWGDLGGCQLTVDGQERNLQLCADFQRQGVLLADFATAAREHAELVQAHYMQPVTDPERLQMSALNEAFRNGGRFLYVPKNVDVALPLSFVYQISQPGLAVFPYTLIVVGRGSRVTIVEDVSSADFAGQSLYNGITDIHVEDGGQLNYYFLQGWGRNVFQYSQQRAWLSRDASYTTFAALAGGQLTYAYNETDLQQAGATGVVLGLVYGDHDQSFLSRTVQNHIGPNTTSDLLVKTVLKGRAHSDYSGWITIAKAASKTSAQQTQRNLLLSKEAKADSIPNLEILTNDVACSHAAAVGPIDEEQLFYLESRGLPRDAAEHMVVQGFVEDVILRIPQPALQQGIRNVLRARLGLPNEED